VQAYVDSGKLAEDEIKRVANDLMVQRYLELLPAYKGKYFTTWSCVWMYRFI